jgi:hypothetical protein
MAFKVILFEPTPKPIKNINDAAIWKTIDLPKRSDHIAVMKTFEGIIHSEIIQKLNVITDEWTVPHTKRNLILSIDMYYNDDTCIISTAHHNYQFEEIGLSFIKGIIIIATSWSYDCYDKEGFMDIDEMLDCNQIFQWLRSINVDKDFSILQSIPDEHLTAAARYSLCKGRHSIPHIPDAKWKNLYMMYIFGKTE